MDHRHVVASPILRPLKGKGNMSQEDVETETASRKQSAKRKLISLKRNKDRKKKYVALQRRILAPPLHP